MGIQPVFRNTLAPVKLVETATNLGIDRRSILRKPAVLFLLCLQQSQERFFDAGGTSALHLPPQPRLKRGIMNFNVHWVKFSIPSSGEKAWPSQCKHGPHPPGRAQLDRVLLAAHDTTSSLVPSPFDFSAEEVDSSDPESIVAAWVFLKEFDDRISDSRQRAHVRLEEILQGQG